MTYEYPDHLNEPDLQQLQVSITESAMTDRAFTGTRWDEDTATIQVMFADALSAGDKAILDGIVAAIP